MDNKEYVNNKVLTAYNLFKNNKFSKKARAIVIQDKKLLVIKINYNNGDVHYLLPGGTVDEGETTKQTVVRETLEEYNIITKPIKYLGKLHYKINMEHNGEKFASRVIDYYYICKFISSANESEFGIEGEFTKNDRKYTKTKLSLQDLKKIHHKDLNDMDKKNFDKLIAYMESNY